MWSTLLIQTSNTKQEIQKRLKPSLPISKNCEYNSIVRTVGVK